MNNELRNFIATYLRLEEAFDTRWDMRATLMAFNPSVIAGVRDGLASIVQDRTISIGEYEAITAVEFPDSDTLYAYLSDLYAYLFENGPQIPSPPDQD